MELRLGGNRRSEGTPPYYSAKKVWEIKERTDFSVDLLCERTYAHIDLDKLIRNLKKIRKLLQPNCALMAVLKSNAYGHGLEMCSSYMEPYVDAFAVATLEEGLTIRRCHVKKPVLLLGLLSEKEVPIAAANNIGCNLCGSNYAEMISRVLVKAGRTMWGHIEYDTGMNRTGIQTRIGQERWAAETAKKICQLPNLRITGSFTHFSCAEDGSEESRAFTERQFMAFREVCRELENAGFSPGIRHTSSTGPFLAHPEYCMDMVRLGMLPYGQSISVSCTERLGLEPVLTWYGRIVEIRQISAGEAIGYGRSYCPMEDSRIAVISVGYADGYPYGLANCGVVQIHGKSAPVRGKICMDFLLADITNIPETQVGEKAVLLGGSGKETLHSNQLAARLPYATCGGITTAIGARVPRVYTSGGKIIGITKIEQHIFRKQATVQAKEKNKVGIL